MSFFNNQPINFTLTTVGTPSRYHVVQASGGNSCGLATAATQTLVGIIQNAPLAGEHATICPLGISKAVAGAAVAVGAKVTTNGSGRVITISSGAGLLGYALEAAGADGDTIAVQVVAGGASLG
jgi:hypothetical protein